jgi:hypothetical protein
VLRLVRSRLRITRDSPVWVDERKRMKEKEMVDNQHQKIKGYRDLSEAEIAMMNEAKELAAKVGDLADKLKLTDGLDQRWVAIGRTELQQGFMALIRAIAQPTTF